MGEEVFYIPRVRLTSTHLHKHKAPADDGVLTTLRQVAMYDLPGTNPVLSRTENYRTLRLFGSIMTRDYSFVVCVGLCVCVCMCVGGVCE